MGKIRLFALVLALLFCSTMVGCADDDFTTTKCNEIYLASAYETMDGIYNDEPYYHLWYNYVYTQKTIIDAYLIDVDINIKSKSTDEYIKSYGTPVYIGGENERHNRHIEFLTPYMSISKDVSFPQYLLNDILIIELEIFHTQFYPKKTIICKKTFTQKEFKAQLKTLLQKDDD